MSRKQRREEAARQQRAASAAQAGAAGGEKPPGGRRLAPSLTRKRLAFALAWADADPEDNLQDIARRAGYSESVSTGGKVAEICRDPEVIRVRDRRLADLQAASGVTVEDQLIGLQQLAENTDTPAKERVAARRAILAWYARDKGQQQAPAASAPRTGGGLTEEARQELEFTVLGVSLFEEDDSEGVVPPALAPAPTRPAEGPQ